MPTSTTDRLLRGGIVLLGVLLVYFIYTGIHPVNVEAGDTAPAFAIHTDNGGTVSVPDLKGKLLVLNFWASWCQPCRDETPSLSQFAAAYADKGVVVLGVSVDKDAAKYRAFLDRFKPAFLTVREGKLHEDFGTFMYPETYFINAKGKVVHKLIEPVDWMSPRITKLVDSLL
jgi:cytochrome c biogenesis protein CcmG, thiol:disulfide interchange protein DsbE